MLIHFAKHRGFRSNRKSDLASKGEKGGTLESSKANHDALAHYRTLGEMFLNDPRFADRKRNRDGSYTAMTVTNLQSLASSATAGWQSAQPRRD